MFLTTGKYKSFLISLCLYVSFEFIDFVGVIMTILQGGVVRRLPPHLHQKSAVIGLYLIIPSFIVIGLANSARMLYAGMILFAICEYIQG